MLEWMIVLGAACGAVAVFGLLVIVLNCLWLLRAARCSSACCHAPALESDTEKNAVGAHE